MVTALAGERFITMKQDRVIIDALLANCGGIAE